MKAIFLDRDGVLNRKAPEGSYITSWEQFELLPGVIEAVRQLRGAGFTVVVVTNQRGVAFGRMSRVELEDIHARLRALFTAQGAPLDAIYCCTHDVTDACPCRKPAPGMLLQAARERQIDLQRSWMIGDSDSDIEAGKRAGCRTVKVGLHPSISPPTGPDLFALSLMEAATGILQREGR